MSRIKTRISPIMAIFMIGVALIYDGAKALINLITFGFLGWLINPFINIWAQMTFFFWFTFLGVGFFKKGKLQGAKIASMSVPSVIGLIPLIDSLPFWASGTVTTIAIAYAEDLLESLSPEALQAMAKVAKRMSKKKGGATETASPTGPDTKTKKEPPKKFEQEKKEVEKPKIEEIKPATNKTPAPEKKPEEVKPKDERKQTEKPKATGEEKEKTKEAKEKEEEGEKKEKPKTELEKFGDYAEDLAKRKRLQAQRENDQFVGRDYSEFVRETGEMEPVEEDRPDDWPIAI